MVSEGLLMFKIEPPSTAGTGVGALKAHGTADARTGAGELSIVESGRLVVGWMDASARGSWFQRMAPRRKHAGRSQVV